MQKTLTATAAHVLRQNSKGQITGFSRSKFPLPQLQDFACAVFGTLTAGGSESRCLRKGNCAPAIFSSETSLPVYMSANCPVQANIPEYPHASLHDPKELVIWFARQVQCKLRSVGIEGYVGFHFSLAVFRSAVAALTITLEEY